MKKAIVISIIVLVIVGLAVGAYFLWFAEKDLFELELSEVKSITLQSGNTGEYAHFDSEEDIQWFITRLNGLKYKTSARRFGPADPGWTYRILIKTKSGTADYIIGGSFVDEGKKIYTLTDESKEIIKEILARFPK